MVISAHLTPRLLERLGELIRADIDSYKAFQAAADAADDPQLTAVLRELARQRRHFAEQLKPHVEWQENQPATAGSARGRVHRWWIDVRSRLTGGSEFALVSDVARGEQQLARQYRQVLEKTRDDRAVTGLLSEHLAAIESAAARLAELREAMKPGPDP
ncbi:MAG: PA2169 family four-helix-bundle protein [Phycisphaeraceae bacterium]